MDIDEEEDFYSPEPSAEAQDNAVKQEVATAGGDAVESPKNEVKAELEEGEEEDEGADMDEDEDDSDIDIITERKDGTKAAPPPQTRYNDIKNIPQRSTTDDMAAKPAPAKSQSPTPAAPKAEAQTTRLAVPSADQAAAAASSSKIDVNAIPEYPGTGKRLTELNIDEDLADHEKPWRKPGTDISDYFNYGFDEFTWAVYASKQESTRQEYNAESMNKKFMDDIGGMMMMGGMNMPGQGAPQAAGGAGGMQGMDGMPPEMQAMMQQMMGSGMDPSQMDPSAMSAMFSNMQNQGGNAGGQGGYGGGQGGYGGYDQQGMGGGGGGGGGRGFGGRGRGGRRW